VQPGKRQPGGKIELTLELIIELSKQFGIRTVDRKSVEKNSDTFSENGSSKHLCSYKDVVSHLRFGTGKRHISWAESGVSMKLEPSLSTYLGSGPGIRTGVQLEKAARLVDCRGGHLALGCGVGETPPADAPVSFYRRINIPDARAAQIPRFGKPVWGTARLTRAGARCAGPR
jgi:hypothetical protein